MRMQELHIISVSVQAKHAQGEKTSWGIDGYNGNIVDMADFGIWEPLSVKVQVFKAAIEVIFYYIM